MRWTWSAPSSDSGGVAGTRMAVAELASVFTSSDGSSSDKTDGYHYVRARGVGRWQRFAFSARMVDSALADPGRHERLSRALQQRAWSLVVPHHAGGARPARHHLDAAL